MTESLQNPFKDPGTIAKKRLFGQQADEQNKLLTSKQKEKLDSVLVKYGDKMIMASQAKFFKDLEKQEIYVLGDTNILETRNEKRRLLSKVISCDDEGNVRRINFENIRFSELPESIGNLDYLLALSLNNVGLRELPASITNLKNLHGLYLAKNKLRNLPLGLDKLKKLEKLDLQGNPLILTQSEIKRIRKELSFVKNIYF